MTFSPPVTSSEVETALDGRYRNISPVFSGGQGAVFKATRLSSETPVPSFDVALKIYYPSQIEERTAREVEALRSLTCQNVVRLRESGTIELRGETLVFVATDFIEGEVLAARIDRSPLPIGEILKIGKDISYAIDHLWKKRIVHRDIKPANIMISSSGESILIDLGVARHLSLTTLTLAGFTWGTLGYMAPEHANARKQLSCKADIFSLGVVLQECLIGRHPTRGRQELLSRGGLSTASLVPNLSGTIRDILDRMVSKEPHLRPNPNEAYAIFDALLTL